MDAPKLTVVPHAVLDSQGILHRGVHAMHPAISEARKGWVIPGKSNGSVTPEMHNFGGQQADSPYTSWTHNVAIARKSAMRCGPGGVLLHLPAEAPEISDTWSWVYSPDEYGEMEVLLRGVRSGATVELL